MDTAITAAVVALLGAFVLAAGFMSYRLWRAGSSEQGPLLMHRVLEREGVSVEGCTDDGALAQIAAAARGCLLCRDQETCRAWLGGDTSASLEEFCPNAELIGRMKADGRVAPSNPG
jgi:hypothetical protein